MKHFFKILLKVILSVQLCFTPFYGYSVPESSPPVGAPPLSPPSGESDNPIQSILENLKKDVSIDNPETYRRLKEITDLAEAVETGSVEEFLKNNPEVKQERDHFLLTDQKAEIIGQHFSAEEGQIVERVEQVVHLNNYNSRPIHTVFKRVGVIYNSESKTLTFEGISGDTVMLRQHIPNMDIISYANDNEMLTILDKKRGLLLVDMFFVRAYLGLAPVPVFRIIPINKLNTEAFSDGSQISLEFINRSVRPPDIVPGYINNIGKNFSGDSLFTAGDFMISALDKEGQKHLVQFLKRTELAGWIKLNYEVLDIMTKVVAPHLMEAEGLKAFSEDTNNLKERDPNTMLDRILSALFTKKALQKFSLASQGVKVRAEQLDNMSPRDTMLFNEWQESFQKISERLKTKKAEEKPYQDTVLTTEQIAEYYQKKEEEAKLLLEEQKGTRSKALRIMANITSSIKTGVSFVDHHRVSALTAGFLASGFVFPETFIKLANIMFSMIHSLVYSGSFAKYEVTSLPNLIVLIVFLPGAIMALSAISIPFMKKLKSILPKSFSLAGQVYHPAGWMEDAINKWGRTNIFQRIVGIGMKVVAYAIYPFWNYVAGLVGQPHFFSALQKGLNPFQKVDPKSDIGETAKLKEPVRYGVQRPHWRHNGEFNRQRQLQNVALAKNQRIQSIAWLMASLATAEKEGVSPEQIIIYGTSSLNLQDLERVHNDVKLKMEMIWVMKHLIKEIQALGEMDIRKEISELEPEMIVRYYERSKELAKEARSHSTFRKKMRAFMNTGLINTLRRNINLRTITGANKDQHEMLKNVPTDFVTGRVMKEFSSDHLLVSLIPLLTTERSEFGLEHFSQLVVNGSNFSGSSKPHLNEVWLNVIVHFFISGAQRTMTFTNKTTTIQKAHTQQEPVYEPLERHTHKIKVKSQGEATYYGRQFAYLKSGGKQDNLGGVMWRSYVSRLRTIQMTLSLMVGLRLALGGQGITDAVLAFFLFHFAGQWMFGWPWDIISGGARLNGHELAENQKKMDDLRLNLSRITRAVHTEEENLQKEYKSAINNILALYGRSSSKRNLLRRYLVGVNHALSEHLRTMPDYRSPEEEVRRIRRQVRWNRDIKPEERNEWVGIKLILEEVPYPFKEVFEEDIQTMRRTSETLMKVLAEYPPLPNQANRVGDVLFTTIFGAVLTTYLFVALSVWTFSPEYLNLKNIGMWAGINYTLYALFYLAYKKGLKDHIKSIRNFREPLRRGKESLIEWKQAFKDLKAPEESWRTYFYDRFLDIGRSASALCRGAFRKTGQD